MNKVPSLTIDMAAIGNEDQFKRTIRLFTLDKLLKRINAETSKIMMDHEEEDVYGTRTVSFTLIKDPNNYIGFAEKKEYTLEAWKLIDLSYKAVLFTHDHRGRDITGEDEIFYALVSLGASYFEEQLKYISQEFEQKPIEIILLMWGFAGEQFRIQKPKKVFDNACRELFILFESSKKTYASIDICAIVQERVGVEWKKVITSLMIAWQASTENAVIDDVANRIDEKELALSKEEYLRVLDYYTATYQDIKNSEFGRQHFLLKPYVKTDRKEVISINCYLSLFAVENCIFWIVRDHYKDKDSQEFVAGFGRFFEKYFEELLETYLESGEYEAVPEAGEKRADWNLQLGDYKILVEQKSALLSISAKQQYSDVNTIKKFAVNSIVEALEQLEKTERAIGDDKYIKIVLIYENYLDANALETIFHMDECDVENDKNYWILTIEEMEKLLSLYATNKEMFNSVMEEKTRREHEQPNLGIAINQVLADKGVIGNPYLDLSKFDRYRVTEIIRGIDDIGINGRSF